MGIPKLKIAFIGVSTDVSIIIRSFLSHSDIVGALIDVPGPGQGIEALAAGDANCVFLNPGAFDWPPTEELLSFCTFTFPVCVITTATELMTWGSIPYKWQERLRNYIFVQSDAGISELRGQLEISVRGCHRYLLKQLVRLNLKQIADQAGSAPELADKALQTANVITEIEIQDKSELGTVLGLNSAQMKTLFDEALGDARRAAQRAQMANFMVLGAGLLLFLVTSGVTLVRKTADTWTFATGGMGAAAMIAALVTSPSRRIGSSASQLIYVQTAYFSFLTQVRLLNALGPETAIQRSERLEAATAKLLEQLKSLPGDR